MIEQGTVRKLFYTNTFDVVNVTVKGNQYVRNNRTKIHDVLSALSVSSTRTKHTSKVVVN